MHPRALSNSWLVADRPGGHAVVIDTGGPFEPVRQRIEELRLTLTHVLCTHHHWDHVVHNSDYREQFGCSVCGGAREADRFEGLDIELVGEEELCSGELRLRTLHIPGHTAGQIGVIVNDEAVFTGDTLFRGSVGGTVGPGHTTFEDLRHSIVEVILRLPDATVIYPGHMGTTTVAEERATNPFVRAWSGSEPLAETRCRVGAAEGRARVVARDYDGGQKVWVTFDDGQEAVVPGSRVALTEAT